ncbi:helix-turn-helix domain-containing protein [Azospirillum himalayense]|uniref:Helix-turn-helix domain-containing protein n=1 Tax=Azospirillum himalayense TaxID=654847 RepID=A0ABW0GGF5_9PROT
MLRTLREQRNLTQEDLAELIDRSVQAVSKMERGLTFPKLETLISISERLGVSLRDLVGTFDPTASVSPDRMSIELSIIESSRHLTMRDLKVIESLMHTLRSVK